MSKYKDNRDPTGIQITTCKLNEKNYLLWEKLVRVYLGAWGKLDVVASDKPSFSDVKSPAIEEEWEHDNFMVMPG